MSVLGAEAMCSGSSHCRNVGIRSRGKMDEGDEGDDAVYHDLRPETEGMVADWVSAWKAVCQENKQLCGSPPFCFQYECCSICITIL